MKDIMQAGGLWKAPSAIEAQEAASVVRSFLDVATTSYGRATHYNTREEQVAAERRVHDTLFGQGRDLYEALLLMPGVTDRARQIGIGKLLSNPRSPGSDMFLNPSLEREILVHLIGQLPVPRMFKLFDAFRGKGDALGVKRSNNARTRKLVLSTILGSRRLDLWAVKYRSKMKRVLGHVWGVRRASIIASILKKDGRTWTKKEKDILRDNVLKFVGNNKREYVFECIAFVFGRRDRLKVRLLKAFVDARVDILAGEKLPMEVLEGIRGTYHPTIGAGELLKIKARSGTMTDHNKRVVQKRANKAGVKVDMDPLRYDPVDLYIHAFENGVDADIVAALKKKAQSAAAALPVRYENVAILVDASRSMKGSKEQPMRPLATALSLRDMLQETSDDSMILYCGGVLGDDQKVVKPQGDTSLAEGLLGALGRNPDAVYVLSDGYENAPAGRFQDVLVAARGIGIKTPVFHMNPVFAAEGGSVRQLCDNIEGATTMPVKSPSALATTMLRGLLESDPQRGINALVQSALRGSTIESLALIGGES